MIDCLIIGFNDINFHDYVNMLKSMGTNSGAYKDTSLDFIWYEDQPYRSMDILNHFHFQGQADYKPFHNADFMWPVTLYLGTYLSRRDLSFDYVNLFHLEKDKLREKLIQNDILTIAITTTMYVTPHPIMDIMSFIKKYNKTAKVIIGGPHILNQAMILDRANTEQLFAYMGADFYIINSEGEQALAGIIQALKQNSNFDDIHNIAYKEQDYYIFTAKSPENNSLEDNMVGYHLFPRDEIGEFISLRTSKSCPFKCSFCNYPEKGGEYTYVSVACIEKELNAIKDIGTVNVLTFVDDTLNVPKKRFKEMLRMMIQNKYGFEWNCQYRSDHGDEETIELMKEAGCTGVFLGVESGSDQILKMMNKTARRKDYLKAISKFREVGILTHASLIVGFPGETYHSFRNTLEFIEDAQPDFFRPQLWYCDPIAPISRQREQLGLMGVAYDWYHDTMDARTARDLLEEMFLSVEHSIWLPENSFDLWSIFYLQKKKMSLKQINFFLRCFNAIIKDKLLYPERKVIDPSLLSNLIKNSQFTNQEQLDMYPIQIRSGAKYTATEQFWVQEFSNTSPSSNINWLYDKPKPKKDDWQTSVPFIFEKTMTNDLQTVYQASLSLIFLAIHSILLSRLNGKDEITIISSINKMGIMPLKFPLPWELSFREFIHQIQHKIFQTETHQLFAFRILTNPLRMAEYSTPCPIFDIGYTFRGLEGNLLDLKLDDVLRNYPVIKQQMLLILDVVEVDDKYRLQFLYRQGLPDQGTMNTLIAYFSQILKQISEKPVLLLEEILLNSKYEKQEIATDIGIDKAFNFT